MNEIVSSIASHQKLERDRGLEALLTYINTNPDHDIETPLLELLPENDTTEVSWEQVHGTLQAFALYINTSTSTPDFLRMALTTAKQYLTNREARVRLAAGLLLGTLAKHQGRDIYLSCKSDIITGIKNCLQRHQEADEKIQDKLNGHTESVFHDTAGWGNLETHMKAMESIITNTGPDFDACIDDDLLDLVFDSLSHTNRFARETGYNVCGALVSIHPRDEGAGNKGHVWSRGKRFADALEKGLADNWSQVRMAACSAVRAFLLGLPPSGRDEFYPQLLPSLCLNRYYIAEGVRIHCQTTWRMLFSVSGVKAVENQINSIVPFYIQQSEADNHAVREAACACIAELATKLGSDPVKLHVPDLINALLVCFEDDSWPVRDAACTACGNFVAVFSKECQGYVDGLMPLFYMNLEDNIPSVRHGAAIALTNITKAYPELLLDKVVEKLADLLDNVNEQTDEADSSKADDVEDSAHTNQVMYSCGSLAPKMGRGGSRAPGVGGCSAQHHFRRLPEPWERTDGAVRLFMELSDLTPAKPLLLPLFSKIAAASLKRDYEHHRNLLETIYKCLPMICRRLTKTKIKPFINEFFHGLFYGLKSDMNLLKAASVECLQSLSLMLGPNILRGRIEMTEPDMVLHIQTNFPETIGC